MSATINLQEIAIRNFLSQDKIALKDFPDKEVSNKFKNTVIDFSSIKNEVSRKEFRDLLTCIFTRQIPYKKTSERLYYVIRLAGFLSDKEGLTTIPDKELKESFDTYCDEQHYYKDTKRIILVCKEALLDFYDTRTGFNRDTWDSSVFTLDDNRINKAGCTYRFYFRNIRNVANREVVKPYIKYLLGLTELAFSSIINTFSDISKFCEFLGDKSLLDVDSKDIWDYLDLHSDLSQDTYNHFISRIKGLYEYLRVKLIYNNFNPVLEEMYRNGRRKHNFNTVSEYVILQIFNNLHKAPFNYMLIYLINYCTGMRISDVCQLQTDCLYCDGNNGYYIKVFNCQKMQKPLMNLIPQALYSLIQEQIKIINSLEYEEKYLFPSETKRNYPYNSQTFRTNFKKICHEWDIKCEDGTPYNYTTHSYRHTIATDLHENYNVPIVTIQKAVLWHKEIQMTLSYIDKKKDIAKMKADKYFSRYGEAELSQWLKDNLKAQVLPNGFCGLNSKSGVCPTVDACLSCTHFLTSKKFLKVHKEQLATLKSRLKIYEVNNWIPNIETAKKQIKELEEIIQLLEETEDRNASTTISPNKTSS